MPRTHRKVSVRLPAELLDDIEDRVGPRNVSRYIAETVAENQRRLALREWLDLMDATHGPVSAEAEESARRSWHGDE